MHTLIGTAIDKKNIDFAKILFGLRQDLDIYCLISVNAGSITRHGVGNKFFGHIQQRAIENISLTIFKVYEYDGKHELNSIDGFLRNLDEKASKALNELTLKEFIQKYDGQSEWDDNIIALKKTFKRFQKKYKEELTCFKNFRHKKVAHSEYGNTIKILPSYYAMEQLFNFAVDFYDLVSKSFVGVSPANLRNQRQIKLSLKSLLQELGIKDIEDDMQ